VKSVSTEDRGDKERNFKHSLNGEGKKKGSGGTPPESLFFCRGRVTLNPFTLGGGTDPEWSAKNWGGETQGNDQGGEMGAEAKKRSPIRTMRYWNQKEMPIHGDV